METSPKPRITYAQFVEQQPKRTVAWVIERFINEMNGLNGQPAVKTLGKSHEYSLRRIQREPIGQKLAAELTKHDIIEHAKWRRLTVGASTVGQDIIFITGVLKYAPSAWTDCEDISDAPVQMAKPFMNKHALIAKSMPRDRRPTDEEIQRLVAYFEEQNRFHGTVIDMVQITLWQIRSSRRISESCRLLWEDWNREHHTILVRNMKDPKRRNKSKVVALPIEAQQMLEEMWPNRNPEEPRIFPFNSKSCSARYTLAKKDLGIQNLRLHDSRRECGTRLVEEKGFSTAEAILFTGHETVAVFERTYLKQKPELVKDGPKAQRLVSDAELNAAANLGFTAR
jgi:integrase